MLDLGGRVCAGFILFGTVSTLKKKNTLELEHLAVVTETAQPNLMQRQGLALSEAYEPTLLLQLELKG